MGRWCGRERRFFGMTISSGLPTGKGHIPWFFGGGYVNEPKLAQPAHP
jgi:hypothetical protein